MSKMIKRIISLIRAFRLINLVYELVRPYLDQL